MNRVVIVGASVAGYRVAEALRSGGYAGEVLMVGDEDLLPYDRPPLSKAVLTEDAVPDIDVADPGWYLANGVQLRLGKRATALDPANKLVFVGDEAIPYDHVVVATGARARNPFGELPAGAHFLRSMDDALALREAIRTAHRVAIIGGGFIGLEVASAVRSVGTEAVVIEAAEIPLARILGPEAALRVGAIVRDAGVTLKCGVGVDAFLGDGMLEGLRLSDGTDIACEVAVVGVGAIPNTEWLAGAGLTIEPFGLICDATGRAGADVWGVGDATTWLNAAGVPERHEHWTSAHSQARVVAQNILEGSHRTVEGADYVWSDQFGRRITIAGSTREFDEICVAEGADDAFSVLYANEGILVGACIVDQPRLAIQCRQWIAQSAAVETVSAWRQEAVSVS